jgi:hypothetical protein
LYQVLSPKWENLGSTPIRHASLRGYPVGYTCCATDQAGAEKVGRQDGEMKNFYSPTGLDWKTMERIRRIVELSRRRDCILDAPEMDLEALQVLTADYEAANMPSAAADLRRRLEYYQEKEISRAP